MDDCGCILQQRRDSGNLDKVSAAVFENFIKTIKVLVLGGKNSGKNTLKNQLIYNFGNGFNLGERIIFTKQIRATIHDAFCTLIEQMDVLNQSYSSTLAKNYALEITSKPFDHWILDTDYVQKLQSLWRDSGIQYCFLNKGFEILPDNILYFINNLNKISSSAYVPEIEDILRNCEQRSEYKSKDVSFTPQRYRQNFKIISMYPPGNSINTKWLQAFDGIDVFIFLIACSEFDEVLKKDPTKNRLSESIDIFKNFVNSKYLNTAGVIVFLNKQDILEEKIRIGKTINSQHFPDYEYFALSEADDISGEDFTMSYEEYIKTRTFIKNKVTKAVVTRRPSVSYNYPKELNMFVHYTSVVSPSETPDIVALTKVVITTENIQKFQII